MARWLRIFQSSSGSSFLFSILGVSLLFQTERLIDDWYVPDALLMGLNGWLSMLYLFVANAMRHWAFSLSALLSRFLLHAYPRLPRTVAAVLSCPYAPALLWGLGALPAEEDRWRGSMWLAEGLGVGDGLHSVLDGWRGRAAGMALAVLFLLPVRYLVYSAFAAAPGWKRFVDSHYPWGAVMALPVSAYLIWYDTSGYEIWSQGALRVSPDAVRPALLLLIVFHLYAVADRYASKPV
jgi:hypothetical protein